MKRLKDIWSNLPENEHCKKYFNEEINLNIYEVCGKKFQETASIEYVLNILQNYYNQYGQRAILAAENLGIDWKSISHCFRAAYQIKQIFTEGTIKFPLKEAEFLRQVKLGKFHFTNELSPKLDELMDEIEELSKNSNYPEKADRKFWNNWLIKTIEDNL